MTDFDHQGTTADSGIEQNWNLGESANPLEGLVDRAAKDIGVPFDPVVLEALYDLKLSDRAGFESLRHELKRVGVRVTALDETLKSEFGEDQGTKQSQTEVLLHLAKDVKLYHTSDGEAYAQIEVKGHRENWASNSKGFKDWLSLQYYRYSNGAPNTESMAAAINVLSARAKFDGPEEQVYLRVGTYAGKHYIDICNDDWQVIEIGRRGWRVLNSSPVNFTRTPGMQSFPMPVPGGDIKMLRKFINVVSEADFVLVVSWVLASLKSTGPYPLLVLSGEQGSSKSTVTRVLRGFVDPNKVPLRPLPKDDQNLFIAAKNAHLMAYDNLSHISGPLSDALCRLATGGGYSTRKLYSDDEEILIEAMRPMLLNGIGDVVARPDLADRSIYINLERIPEHRRKSETEFLGELEEALPKITGALLDAFAWGIERLLGVKLQKAPRMADFARWATACEEAFCPAGTFMASYNANREMAVHSTIDSDPLASALLKWISVTGNWTGTASELLALLVAITPHQLSKDPAWPKTAKNLSTALKRLAPPLGMVGVDIFKHRSGPDGTRLITITYKLAAKDPSGARDTASAPSAASVFSSRVRSGLHAGTPVGPIPN